MQHLGTKQLETPRLILRKFTIDDADNMYLNWANDREVTKFLTWPPHSNIEVTKEVLTTWINNYANLDSYQWCIALKATNKAIGSIGVVHMNELVHSVEIGYCISKAYWHQGITSEALSALISFFFNEVGMHRVESRHDPNNPHSGQVMLKCGLKYEGTRMKADFNNTGICDVSLYGLVNPSLSS